MASERIESAEKIVRMTEWNEAEPWEYAEGEVASVDTLAAAKRFVSAQVFLLSWQEGKVPTGWRRPRRLGDFDGKYPQGVVDAAEHIIAQRIEERNMQKTAKINAVISAARTERTAAAAEPAGRAVAKQRGKLSVGDIEGVKKDLSNLSDELFDAKNALRTAMNAAADVSLRLEALSKAISQH